MAYKKNSLEATSRAAVPATVPEAAPHPGSPVAAAPAADACVAGVAGVANVADVSCVASVTSRDNRDALLRLLSVRTLRLMELLRQADAEVARRLLRAHPAEAAELATVFTVTGGIQWLSARREGKGSIYPAPPATGPAPPGPAELAQSGVRSLPATPATLGVEPTAPATLWGAEEDRTQPGVVPARSDAAERAQLDAAAQARSVALSLQPQAMAEQAARLPRAVLFGEAGREDSEDTESSGVPAGALARRRVSRAWARR